MAGFCQIAREFDRAWIESAESPDIWKFISANASPELSVKQLLDLIRVDQHHRWNSGEPTSAEYYFENCPALANDPESRQLLILEEFGYLEESGRIINPSSFLARFSRFISEQELKELEEELSDPRTETISNRQEWIGSKTLSANKLAEDKTAILKSGLPRTQIGSYRILEKLGEGGFGIVFAAEQKKPIRRKVAIKILKSGINSDEVIARFQAERQALALMDHPCIARVIEGGATDQGEPYFVMELVRGLKITDYCDQHKLSIRQRLELFLQICEAVQHTHQKGIIHRDIKPSNVLVELHDGKPVPKMLDFGVAKSLNQQLSEQTVHTQLAQMIGTPLYMSPEQAERSGLDVDTRSDIYSLGALLFELLTGTTPISREEMRNAGAVELIKLICEKEAPNPSAAISSGDQESNIAEIARNRGSDVPKLKQQLQRDLDWIILKTLEKDRNRRYETVNGLALDIKRYLNDEPVSASPPSTLYRLRKFAKRNRVMFVIGSITTLLLLAATVVSAWLAVIASNAQREADLRWTAEKKARARAVEQQNIAEEQKGIAEDRRIESLGSLYQSYVAQAQASQLSRRPGQKINALKALAKAEELRKQLFPEDEVKLARLRDEAIAGLGRIDIEDQATFDLPALDSQVEFDPSFNLYAHLNGQGGVSVRSGADHSVISDISLSIPGNETFGRRFSHDGRFLAGHFPKGSIWIWDRQKPSNEPCLVIDGAHRSSQMNFCFCDCGKHLGVVLQNGKTEFWDLIAKRKVKTFDTRNAGIPIMSSDGKRIAISKRDSGGIEIWDVKKSSVVHVLTAPDYVDSMAWSADRRWLACSVFKGYAIHVGIFILERNTSFCRATRMQVFRFDLVKNRIGFILPGGIVSPLYGIL